MASGLYDAVMLLSPIPFHADQSVAVLNAGLHCACTVPMATTVADCQRVTQARKASGKTYSLLETILTSIPNGGTGSLPCITSPTPWLPCWPWLVVR